MSLSVSVSNLDLFRVWRHSEDLDLEWLLRRLRGEEPQTEQMKAGEAFHSMLETAETGETASATAGDYKFNFLCDCTIAIPLSREVRVEKQYGDLLVRGRVDGFSGLSVTDYKTTGQFDADRLLEGFQWRFYLSMTGCDSFLWKVFVLSQRFFNEYDIVATHELKQHRYEGLESDCERLTGDFLAFVRQLESSNIPWTRAAVLESSSA